MNPTQTRVTLLLYHVVDGEKKQRFTWYYQVSSEKKKGYSQDEERRRTIIFLTHGTTEEGLDFVSVLQPVPHTGKHFQSGYLTASAATREVDKGMYANRERDVREERGRKGRKRQGKEGRKEIVKKYINKQERQREDILRTF